MDGQKRRVSATHFCVACGGWADGVYFCPDCERVHAELQRESDEHQRRPLWIATQR